MKQNDFWIEVDQRVEENQSIVRGGLPKSWARVMSWVGLRFWLVGLLLSAVPAVWLWTRHYQQLIGIVRVMIWR